uniref:Uncharacterized protein n=1 Tax=Rhizophora mucronata TaxID=61149 RepID=A0A2P2KJQ5_RHIMU
MKLSAPNTRFLFLSQSLPLYIRKLPFFNFFLCFFPPFHPQPIFTLTTLCSYSN